MKNLINSKIFQKQLEALFKKYVKINKDLNLLDSNFEFESFSDLWNWFRKYRIKNSSIPTWKRWGFRVIVKIFWNKVIPIIIFSKREKENVSKKEFMETFELIYNELFK